MIIPIGHRLMDRPGTENRAVYRPTLEYTVGPTSGKAAVILASVASEITGEFQGDQLVKGPSSNTSDMRR